MYKLIISLVLMGFSLLGKAQYEQKNFIGIEAAKPLFLFAVRANSREGPMGSTIELTHLRRLTSFIIYRGTYGYATYIHSGYDSRIEYRSKGFFSKQGIDFTTGRDGGPFEFLIGLGAYLGSFSEKERTWFKGWDFPDFYSPYVYKDRTYFGGEFAMRLLWNLKEQVSIELSQRLSYIPNHKGTELERQYAPGIGSLLGKNEYGIFMGVELKLYGRF